MDIKFLVNVTARAWALPILSSLNAGTPGRQAPLLAATGASRSAFKQSLDYLMAIGLLERNPGHGHPLRPEFRLTETGKSAARLAQKIQDTAPQEDRDLLRRSWTLPILTTLATPCHFNEIKRTLPRISDRALSQSLKQMETRHWVHRHITTTTRPPRSQYHAINAGNQLSRILTAEIIVP